MKKVSFIVFLPFFTSWILYKFRFQLTGTKRWLPHRLLKHQSLSATVVFRRTPLTCMIIRHLLINLHYIILITYSRHILLLCELFHLLRCKFPLQFCHYREKSEKYIVKGLSLQSNNYGAKELKKLTKH